MKIMHVLAVAVLSLGLAACQIGVDRAVFVFDCPDASGRHVVGVVCNPRLELPGPGERQLVQGRYILQILAHHCHVCTKQ